MVDDKALDALFRTARTHNGWQDKPVSDDLLRQVWDLARMPPTSANCMPARIVFVRSAAAKEKLKPALSPGNLDKTVAAPATAIIAYDTEFFELLPRLYPQADMKKLFVGNPAGAETAAFRNGSLQGAYFILAARALGLDCGPMSGFDNAKVDAAFFPGGKVKSNFLCNLGYGDPAKLRPRNPRLGFDEACRIV
jgi:3-hydroxypropanoate dehydrogenase